MTGHIKADEFNRIFDREIEKYKENLAKDKFVVYPDPQFSMEELIQHKQMSENENLEPKTDEPNVSSILTPEEIAKFSPAPEENGELPGEEPKELTEEEKKVIFIQQLKDSKIKYHPIKHFAVKSTWVETEDVDVLGRKKKRKNKNRMARASRKANR